jgi:hypothetical protein
MPTAINGIGRDIPMANSDSQRHCGLSSAQLEELIRLSGTDPVLASMLKRGSPLTREHYIAHNWGPDLPEEGPGTAEFELELPEPFRLKDSPKPAQSRQHPHQHLWRSEEELVRAVMEAHPGLTEKEARTELKDFGGHFAGAA